MQHDIGNPHEADDAQAALFLEFVEELDTKANGSSPRQPETRVIKTRIGASRIIETTVAVETEERVAPTPTTGIRKGWDKPSTIIDRCLADHRRNRGLLNMRIAGHFLDEHGRNARFYLIQQPATAEWPVAEIKKALALLEDAGLPELPTE